jgi:hypothetical protein
MIVLKTKSERIPAAMANMKHARSQYFRHAKPGDQILLYLTKNSREEGELPIQWVTEFVSMVPDTNNESTKLWGRPWKYIINFTNPRKLEPFDPVEMGLTSRVWDGPWSFAYLDDPRDQKKVLDYISGM